MRRLLKALAVAAVAAMLPLSALSQDATPEEPSDDPGATFLAVVSGTSGSIDGTNLTLDGVDGVLLFTDRPERQAHFAPLGVASAAEAQFAGDPPNAVLSIFESDSVANTVLELTEVVDVGETSLTLAFTLLEGEPTDGDFGPASLFIDPTAPVIVEALCETVLNDPSDEPPAIVEFCSERA